LNLFQKILGNFDTFTMLIEVYRQTGTTVGFTATNRKCKSYIIVG